jgi:hypothetical protein
MLKLFQSRPLDESRCAGQPMLLRAALPLTLVQRGILDITQSGGIHDVAHDEALDGLILGHHGTAGLAPYALDLQDTGTGATLLQAVWYMLCMHVMRYACAFFDVGLVPGILLGFRSTADQCSPSVPAMWGLQPVWYAA